MPRLRPVGLDPFRDPLASAALSPRRLGPPRPFQVDGLRAEIVGARERRLADPVGAGDDLAVKRLERFRKDSKNLERERLVWVLVGREDEHFKARLGSLEPELAKAAACLRCKIRFSFT